MYLLLVWMYFYSTVVFYTIMRLDALYETHMSWLDIREPIDIESNLNLNFQKILPNRGFKPPTLADKATVLPNKLRRRFFLDF